MRKYITFTLLLSVAMLWGCSNTVLVSVPPRMDLKGYGTLQFPQERVYCLAGWSDRVFEIMQKLDRDPEALVRDVESVPLED